MNNNEYMDIATTDEMIDEIKANDAISPFEESTPDFEKNVWDGEKFVTQEEYNKTLSQK